MAPTWAGPGLLNIFFSFLHPGLPMCDYSISFDFVARIKVFCNFKNCSLRWKKCYFHCAENGIWLDMDWLNLISAIMIILAVWLDLPPGNRSIHHGDLPVRPSSKPTVGQVMARGFASLRSCI